MDTLNCDELTTTPDQRAIAKPARWEQGLREPTQGETQPGGGPHQPYRNNHRRQCRLLHRRPRDGPDITVLGFVGWGVGENLMSGTIRVHGNASESAGSSAHGGLLVVEGDSSLRTGISLKGGTIAVAGDVGAMSAFMAQAGTILVGGNAGDALGDSLYEATIYVGGEIRSLGSMPGSKILTEADVLRCQGFGRPRRVRPR